MSRCSFDALLDAMQALLRDDSAALECALAAVPARALLHVALRHKCEALLLHGISRLRVPTRGLRELLGHLQAHCRAALCANVGIEEQLRALVCALHDDDIAFVLLKGAARIHREEPHATSDRLYDLDILVRPDHADRAVAALLRIGYTQPYGSKEIARYARLHHHLAPLIHPENGKNVELHTALAPPGSLSTATTWHAVAEYAEQVDGAAGTAPCFDAFGTAFHHVVHGIGVTRLFDVALLARLLQRDPSLREPLRRVVARERRQPVTLASPLALADRFVLAAEPDARMRAYLEWVARRESLGDAVRERAQFAEAWYANGGRFFGPATMRAFPAYESDNRLYDIARFPFQTIARIVASLALPIVERRSA